MVHIDLISISIEDIALRISLFKIVACNTFPHETNRFLSVVAIRAKRVDETKEDP